jgi:predicted dinucleotide-binding enzyme
MTISIIGTGSIGTAIARLLVNAGLPVSLANSRGPQSLAALVDELGPLAQAVTAQQASQADIVFLAVNWSKIPDAVSDLGPWDGRIVIDANNPIEAPLFKPFDLAGHRQRRRCGRNQRRENRATVGVAGCAPRLSRTAGWQIGSRCRLSPTADQINIAH